MSIRAKMTLTGVYSTAYGGHKVIFNAVYDNKIEEDKRFQKATPTANAEFLIDNINVMSQLVIGKSYYFDISIADDVLAQHHLLTTCPISV